MNIKSLPYTELPDREQRAVARLAKLARWDTIAGGTWAMVLAERADRLKFNSAGYGAMEVVSIVYSASSGHHHPELEAWECPECGQAHLGKDAAYACCAIVSLEEEAA